MGMVSPKTEWGGHWESQTHLHPRPQEVWTSELPYKSIPNLPFSEDPPYRDLTRPPFGTSCHTTLSSQCKFFCSRLCFLPL